MLSDLFSCPICLEQFDKASHLPKIISTCNHTLCSTCIANIIGNKKECPLDRIKFAENVQRSEDFSTSLLVLQIIEEKLKSEYQMCDEHKIIKNLMCLDDKTWICEKCAASMKHKTHDIKSTQQLKTEAQSKKKKLESWIEEFTRQKEEADYYFKGLQKSINTAIAQEFNKITDELKKNDKEIFSNIEALIETYQNEKEKILEKDELLKEKWEKQTSDLANDINSRFVDTFKKLDNKKCPDLQIAKLLKNAKSIEKQHISAVQKLSNTIISAIKDFGLKKEESVSMEDQETHDPSKLIELFDIDIHEDLLTVFAENIPDRENKDKLPLLNLDKLKEIKVLEIQFDKVSFTKQHGQGLKYIHSRCDQLSDLKLFFDGEHFKDEDLTLFCLDPYWATSNLKSLYLDLETSQVSDMSIKKMMTNLFPKMPNLNCLTLRLCKTQITSECIDNSSPDFFTNFADLSRLELLLDGTNITDSWNIKFSKQMKPILKKLKIFSLGLGSTLITDKSIITLAQENLSLMNKMESLFLDIRDTLITDASISAISKNTLFKRLPLQSLTLNIQNTKVTDSGIKDFCSGLPEVANSLKTLDLNFDVPTITDKSIIYLIKKILPQMVSLKVLEISIERTQVTDNIGYAFDGGILKNLQVFSLRIKDTKVTKDGIELLVLSIKYANKPNLVSLDFDFSGIPVDEEIKEDLNQIKARFLLSRRK